jgi:hypothetical protein
MTAPPIGAIVSVPVGGEERYGLVRYVGPLSGCGAELVFVGVELKTDVGDCDGSIDGERYFTCKPNHGLFLTVDDVQGRNTRFSSRLAASTAPSADGSYLMYLRRKGARAPWTSYDNEALIAYHALKCQTCELITMFRSKVYLPSTFNWITRHKMNYTRSISLAIP